MRRSRSFGAPAAVLAVLFVASAAPARAGEPEPSPRYHFLKATEARYAGRLDEAVAELRKAIALDPADPYLLVELGVTLMRQKKTTEARETLQKALSIEPDQLQALWRLSQLESEAKDLPAAEGHLRRIVALRPQDETPQLQLAEVLETRKLGREACTVLETLVRNVPTSSAGLTRLGQCQDLDAKPDKARESFERATALDPHSAEAWKALGALDETQGRYQEAEAAYRTVLRERPDDTAVRLKLGDVYLKLNRGQEAEATYREAISSDEPNRNIEQRLAWFYYQNGDYAGTLEQLQEIRKAYPTSTRLLILIADVCLKLGREQDALTSLDAILGLEPANVRALTLKASLLARQGQEAAAVNLLETALNVEPFDPDACLHLSAIFAELGRLEDGLRIVERAASRHPKDDRLCYARGALYRRSGERTLAEKAFRDAIEINPRNAAAHNALAYMFAEQGVRLEEAIILVRKALDLNPRIAAYHDTLGWAYYKRRNYEEALQELNEALKLGGENPNLLDHLGDVYQKLGDPIRSRGYWQRSLALEPENTGISEKIRDMVRY